MIFNTFFNILFQTVIYVFEIFVNDEEFVLDALKKSEKFVVKLELLPLKLIIWKFVMGLTRWSVKLRLIRWSAMNLNRWSVMKWWFTKMTRWSISIWWSISRIWKIWIRHNVDDSEIRISTKNFWSERFNWSMWFHRNSRHVT